MNDEIVNQSSLFSLIKKSVLCFIFQHILHLFPRIIVLHRVFIFMGTPKNVVNSPRNIMCHVNLYACLLVDHDLWSTLYALYVIVSFCTFVIW